MPKKKLRDGAICPEFKGQTSPFPPFDETGVPFLSIPLNLLYAKQKKNKPLSNL